MRFEAAAGDAERWADALLEEGAISVDLSDPRAGTDRESPIFGEPGEPGVALWPFSRIEALFADGDEAGRALRASAEALLLPLPPVEAQPVAERDWVRETQAQFAPIEPAPGLWIVPSWHQVPAGARLALTLDPGLAFGTGSHPTTRLCLAWLDETGVAGRSVLDYGCGSGILAIAAAGLGAGEVTGVDVDPQAIVSSTENARNNGALASFVLPDALPAGAFDIVVANILANPLKLLAPALAARVRQGGRIALSGILDVQADEVIDAYAPWFTLAPWRRAEGWVLLAGPRQ